MMISHIIFYQGYLDRFFEEREYGRTDRDIRGIRGIMIMITKKKGMNCGTRNDIKAYKKH